jgi:hypothetical protein
VIDLPTAARLGITPEAIDAVLYDAFGEREIATTYTPLNQYYVIMVVDPSFWQDPTALDNIYVSASGGGMVPLSAFTHFEASTAPLAVNHSSVFPSVTYSFNLAPGVALGDAVNLINAAQKKLGVPSTITGSFSGTAQAFSDSLSSEPLLIAAALVAVYVVLGILYESYIHPITILSTLPSAGVGALLALLLTHTDLTVIALIGIILLIGIVKKNAIMMIDFAIEVERREHKSPKEAVFQACLLRFRPIMMTTMAALLGGVPLAVGMGMGSELRRPLGIAIVGGLIVSQALTLYTTPVIYLYMDRLNLWISKFGFASPPEGAGAVGEGAAWCAGPLRERLAPASSPPLPWRRRGAATLRRITSLRSRRNRRATRRRSPAGTARVKAGRSPSRRMRRSATIGGRSTGIPSSTSSKSASRFRTKRSRRRRRTIARPMHWFSRRRRHCFPHSAWSLP